MQQEMIFDLKYDETRKKYIRAKFVIDSKNTIVYFLYSIFKDFLIAIAGPLFQIIIVIVLYMKLPI